MKFTITMEAPDGRFRIRETSIPEITEEMELTAAMIMVILKLFAI
jgi:hypothetical protein